MLAGKLKAGIRVVKDYADDLPHVPGYAAELNQVWTNMIDNAVQAMDGEGTLTLRTAREGDVVLVEIGDTGPGIPAEARAAGVRAVLHHQGGGRGNRPGPGHLLPHRRQPAPRGHRGASPGPGDTRFQVRLPVEEPSLGCRAELAPRPRQDSTLAGPR